MVQDIQLRVLPRVAATDASIRELVLQELGSGAQELRDLRVIRRSIDARQRQVMVNLTVRAWLNEEPTAAFPQVEYRDVSGCPQVIVVGAGPGGLFAALRLIELGLRPIVVERGKDVHARKLDLARIAREHSVNPESNYSFGEGGAGADSDGKLYTRSKKRGSVEKILNVFCQHGASTNILIDAHPHIGTDRLPRVIENIRNTILRCGGEVHFQTRMTRLIIEGNRVIGIEAQSSLTGEGLSARPNGTLDPSRTINSPLGACDALLCEELLTFTGPVILATGHSARDVYRLLANSGIEIEAKGIAVGVRLEHPAQLIDQIQYHSREGRGRWLPAAEYAYVQQCGGRGVYSFCMCPGGFVVPAATGPEQVVVNGMSPSNRGGRWSNSGMVVEIRPEDLMEIDNGQWAMDHGENHCQPSVDNPQLQMLLFQEHLEHLAWQQGGRRQTAPAQRMADFVNGRLSADLPASSYAPGLVASPLHFWMPRFISERLQEGFRAFGRKSHGFLTNEATLIGVETRTSSPVRILRDADTLHHIRLEGLYPCGEGAGYAGGIVSAAIDGERCADAVAQSYRLQTFGIVQRS